MLTSQSLGNTFSKGVGVIAAGLRLRVLKPWIARRQLQPSFPHPQALQILEGLQQRAPPNLPAPGLGPNFPPGTGASA